MKHTKGPWDVSRHESDDILEDEFGIYPPPGEAGPVALVSGSADAHLIGAAPDLLAACQALMASIDADYWYCPWCGDSVGHGDFCPFELVENLTSTALAKATGENND